jgi:lipid A disaccharide synthetase
MIVAGEPSGDTHAASLVNALREGFPPGHFDFFGSTGRKMRAAGVATTVNAD